MLVAASSFFSRVGACDSGLFSITSRGVWSCCYLIRDLVVLGVRDQAMREITSGRRFNSGQCNQYYS